MTLYDANGNRIAPTQPADVTRRCHAVVFESPDAENWSPVRAEDLPDWVKMHDVMADMLTEGTMVALSDDGPFYRAERMQ